MKKRTYLFLKLITFFLVIYLFINFINQDEFLKTIKQIEFKKIFIIFLVFLPMPFLMTVRWYLVVKSFSKISFIEFFRNIIAGFSISLISSSSLALDATKLVKIKSELGTKKSLILVIFDKAFALIFKIFLITILLNLLNVLYLKYYVILFIIITLILFILTIIVIFNFHKICNYFYNKKILNFHLNELIDILFLLRKKFTYLLFANLIIQSLNILLYFLIFYFLEVDFNLLKLAIFVPLVELMSQFQFIIFGLKEMSTVFLFSYLNISHEISLAGALIYTFTDFIIVLILFVLFNLTNYPISRK